MTRMRRHFLLFLLTFSFVKVTIAQHSISFLDNLPSALAQSKIQHKPVFMMCYASWCPHCNAMKQYVFTDSTVANFYNSHFICVEQDMEKDHGVVLHDSLKIKSYPTFIFFDTNDTVIYRMTGEFKPNTFIGEGMNALNPARQLPTLKKQFYADVSSSENCYTYLRALIRGGLDYSDMLEKYFATQSDPQLLSEINWRIISNGVHDVDSKQFQFVLAHQKEYCIIASPDRVEKKLTYTFGETFAPLVESNDTAKYFSVRATATNVHLAKVDSVIFYYDMKLYEKNNNWEAYEKVTLQNVPVYEWNNYYTLNGIINNYLLHVSDKDALQEAIKWAQRSIVLQEQSGTYLLCAKLYIKVNDKNNAITMLQKNIDLASQFGSDHSEADALLKQLKVK